MLLLLAFWLTYPTKKLPMFEYAVAPKTNLLPFAILMAMLLLAERQSLRPFVPTLYLHILEGPNFSRLRQITNLLRFIKCNILKM